MDSDKPSSDKNYFLLNFDATSKSISNLDTEYKIMRKSSPFFYL